jgi:large subunit ribosomal protein L14
MICTGTVLKCADNSGIKKVRCLKVFGNSKKKFETLGNLIQIVIQKKKNVKKNIKKKIFFGLIISIKKKTKRLNGNFISCDNNRVLTISDQYKFLGTRVYGPISKEIRNSNKKQAMFKKIISYSGATI